MRNRAIRVIYLFLLLMAVILGAFNPAHAMAQTVLPQSQQPLGQQPVVALVLEGGLHPAWKEYLKRSQQIAEQNAAQAIIIQLDTPGGSIDLMNKLVEQIRGSQIPIIVYVTPRGAMAASAGTLLTLSAHVAAMAPETTIGAASPVGANGEDIGETMQNKVSEVLKATVRTLSANRPPEAIRLAESMIDNARAVSVDEALKVGLIDIQANDLTDLLAQLNGRKVTIQDHTVTLNTLGADIINVKKTLMEDLLIVLANPNIVFLLLAVGIQAILIEISSPGGWVAGFIGSICLLFATYGMGVLPVNWFGILFLVLAFGLLILEIKAPTHGALTAAGVGSFIIGALVLFNSPSVPSFQRVSVPLVVGTGIFVGMIFFVIIGYALRAQRTPIQMGREQLIGQTGVVNTSLNPIGTVQLGSELWTAIAEVGNIQQGSSVQVIEMENLRIKVRKIEDLSE